MDKMGGPMPGKKSMRPAAGKNGPGDKGKSDGVRHTDHKSKPKPGGPGVMTGTRG